LLSPSGPGGSPSSSPPFPRKIVSDRLQCPHFSAGIFLGAPIRQLIVSAIILGFPREEGSLLHRLVFWLSHFGFSFVQKSPAKYAK